MTVTDYDDREGAILAARLAKAERLADAFATTARRENPDAAPTHIAALAALASEELWLELGNLCGMTRPPSVRTIALARASLTLGAKLAGTDPFAGLPGAS